MHFNTATRTPASRWSERFVDAFAGYDAVVTPSGSCAAMVRHHHAVVAEPLRAAPMRPARRASPTVAPRVYELTEFLVDVLGVTDVGAALPAHASRSTRPATRCGCSGVGDRPRRLLEAVDGLDAGRPAAVPTRAAGSAARSRSRTPTRRWRWALDKVDDVLGDRRRGPDRRPTRRA